MVHDPLETFGQDPEEAHAWIAMDRQALRAASQYQPEFQRAVTRLERIEGEPARIEGVVAERAVADRD